MVVLILKLHPILRVQPRNCESIVASQCNLHLPSFTIIYLHYTAFISVLVVYSSDFTRKITCVFISATIPFVCGVMLYVALVSCALPLSGQTVTPCADITVCGRLGTNHSAASFLYTAHSQRSVSALKAPVGPRSQLLNMLKKKSEDALTCRFRAPAFRCKTIEGNLQAASPRDTTMKSLKGPALNPSMFRPRLDDIHRPALSSPCSGAFPGNKAVKHACNNLKSSFLERHAKNKAKRNTTEASEGCSSQGRKEIYCIHLSPSSLRQQITEPIEYIQSKVCLAWGGAMSLTSLTFIILTSSPHISK